MIFMNILIADDEFAIRRGLLSLPWEQIGIEQVLEAENGLHAKEILTEGQVDILISDIRMPGITGLELAEYVRDKGFGCAVILLTGFSEFEYAQQALRSGVADYLLKPLRQKDILAAVQKAAERLKRERYEEDIIRQHEQDLHECDMKKQVDLNFPKVHPQVKELLEDLADTYTSEVSLNLYADRFHFSIYYLSKLIKKETGYNFVELLNSMRLMHAMDLLERTSLLIGDISEQAGYRDMRYFSQIFKKVTGCNPREFRCEKKDPGSYTMKEILEALREKK